jgi:hypothetical protein
MLERLNSKVFAGLPVLTSAEGIRKSYERFLRNRKLPYMSLEAAGDLITRLCEGVDAPRVELAAQRLAAIDKR